MDIEKIGQVFQGGANVLAGGLMERYQRQKEMQDWYQKQLALDKLQRAETAQKQQFEVGKMDYEMTLNSVKKDFETNPELIPYWQKAQTGDPEAQKVLQVYAGAKHYMDSRTPLSSEQIAELSVLPPQTRHVIINRHLTTLDAETKRQADLKRTEAETAYRTAAAKKLAQDMEQNTPDQKYHAEAVAAVKGRGEDIEKRIAAREKKQAAIQQLDTNILTLEGLVGDKTREKALAKKGAWPGIDHEIEVLRAKQAQLDKQKTGLEDDLQREADMLKKQRPDLFPEEAPAKPQEELSPEAIQYMNSLAPAELAEVTKAIQARTDLPQEVIIRQYFRHKQEKEAAARRATGSAAAMRIK
jgi:hypothetical protein